MRKNEISHLWANIFLTTNFRIQTKELLEGKGENGRQKYKSHIGIKHSDYEFEDQAFHQNPPPKKKYTNIQC